MLHDDTLWSLYGLQHIFDVVFLMLHDDTLWLFNIIWITAPI